MLICLGSAVRVVFRGVVLWGFVLRLYVASVLLVCRSGCFMYLFLEVLLRCVSHFWGVVLGSRSQYGGFFRKFGGHIMSL